MVTRMGIRATALALLLLVTAGHAQTFDLPWRTFVWNDVFDALDTSRFFLGTNTAHDAAARNVWLNPSSPGTIGRLILKRRFDNAYYDVTFDAFLGYRSSANIGGADGIVFLTAPVYDYPTSSGGGLNFDGCNGYGVELDTYYNTERADPSEEHIGLIYQQSGNHISTLPLPQQTLKDSRWHRVTIRQRNGVFDVTLDGSIRVTMPTLNYFPADSYFGFSSATGASFNEHRLDNVSLSVPTRSSHMLADFSACDTVTHTLRFTLRNNHPDGTDLTISGVSLRELDATGEFALIVNPAPTTVQPGDSTSITVRFAGTGSGRRRAILAIAASNGERVEDTVSIQGILPSAQWSQPDVAFPRVHAGGYADETVYLRNSGPFAVTLRALIPSPASFTLVFPTNFPVTIRPGDSIAVTVRFRPAGPGLVQGFLEKGSTCGFVPSLLLSGEGYVSTLRIRLAGSPVMLRPYETTPALVELEDDPSGTGARTLRTILRYDPAVMGITNVTGLTGSLPAGSATTWRTIRPGTTEIQMTAPIPLTTPGPLFLLNVVGSKSDTGCTSLTPDSVMWNAAGSPAGIPYGAGETGQLCINPSCRVPEGLRRSTVLKISNEPNPFGAMTRVNVEVADDAMAELMLVDCFGRTLRALGRQTLTTGANFLDVDAADLPGGLLFFVVSNPSEVQYHPILHLR